jgi:hypothetical protein
VVWFAAIVLAGHVRRLVLMKIPFGCFCVHAAVPRLSSVDSATEARFTVRQVVLMTPAVTTKGKRADGIRQHLVAAPCTPRETAGTAPELVA